MEMLYIAVSDRNMIAYIPMQRVKKVHVTPNKSAHVFFTDGSNHLYNTENIDTVGMQLEKILRWK